MRSEVVYLDGQLRAHAEQLLQLFRLFERLPVRNRLLHPAEHDARAFALERDWNHTGLGLEPDLCELERAPRTNAEPRTGCPAKGSSTSGVKIRIRACPPDSGGSTKTVSEKFISRASFNIVSSSTPRPSVKTASWFPVKASSVKTSATT